MPPKIKTDRDAIISASFEVAKTEGLTGITAQKVSAALKTSVAPIFRVFETVEELRNATAEKISRFHAEYIRSYSFEGPAFLAYGLGYINFAIEYPRLFEAITHPIYAGGTFEEKMSGLLDFVVDSAAYESSFSSDQARELFYHIWIYTHGIACLVCQGSLNLTDSMKRDLLTTAFEAFTSAPNHNANISI